MWPDFDTPRCNHRRPCTIYTYAFYDLRLVVAVRHQHALLATIGTLSRITMHFVGHFSTQIPHASHFSGSMTARLSSMVIACCGHALTHIPHPIHPILHVFLTSAPLALEVHRTVPSCDIGTS